MIDHNLADGHYFHHFLHGMAIASINRTSQSVIISVSSISFAIVEDSNLGDSSDDEADVGIILRYILECIGVFVLTDGQVFSQREREREKWRDRETLHNIRHVIPGAVLMT